MMLCLYQFSTWISNAISHADHNTGVSSLSLQINQWLLFMIYETKFATRTYRKMKYTTTRMLTTTNTIILIVVPLYQFYQAKLRRLFFLWNTEWNRYLKETKEWSIKYAIAHIFLQVRRRICPLEYHVRCGQQVRTKLIYACFSVHFSPRWTIELWYVYVL